MPTLSKPLADVSQIHEPASFRHLAGVETSVETLALDLHRLAGARVAPRRRLPPRDGEVAEAHQPNLIAAL